MTILLRERLRTANGTARVPRAYRRCRESIDPASTGIVANSFRTTMHRRLASALTVLALVLPATPAWAQAWSYPSLQPPRIVGREYNFAVANSDGAGTSIYFQWREEMGPRQQLSLDVGLADPDRRNADLVVYIGGQWAYQIAQSSAEVPLDFLFSIGAYLAGGDNTIFRFPFGLSVGHRFALEGDMALTPYIHPRLSLDLCSDCEDDTEAAVSFDVGLNFELTRTVALRAAALFAGANSVDRDGFGVSIAWTPPSLARLRWW